MAGLLPKSATQVVVEIVMALLALILISGCIWALCCRQKLGLREGGRRALPRWCRCLRLFASTRRLKVPFKSTNSQIRILEMGGMRSDARGMGRGTRKGAAESANGELVGDFHNVVLD